LSRTAINIRIRKISNFADRTLTSSVGVFVLSRHARDQHLSLLVSRGSSARRATALAVLGCKAARRSTSFAATAVNPLLDLFSFSQLAVGR
jgi:hypothetical protein